LKKLAKLVFSLVAFSAVGLAQSITVTSPANGATVSSPVKFAASANGGSAPVTAMRIYVDNVSDYLTSSSSLNTTLALSAGSHFVVVQAWNSAGQVFKSPLTITVGSTSAPASGPYQNNLSATAKWMAGVSVAPDGAILYGSSEIVPYYSNLAAIGLTRNSGSYSIVENWMKWYINHLNWPDQWGVYGTIYDYTYNHGAESSLNNADSTDSYAATFLSLAWAYYSTGNSNAQTYIKTLSYQLNAIANALLATQQSDGLTWAKPNYQIKYLMDNCEAYRGLRDAAMLFQNAFNDATTSQKLNSKAALMLQGINGMWMNGHWAVYKDGIGRFIGPNMGTWYPDATSQMFPVMQGVIPGSDSRSAQVYSAFNSAWPGWPSLSFNSQDPFPWVMIGSAAAQMGDASRVNTFINTLDAKYVNTGFPWTWYSMEAGWFMRLNNYMMHGGTM
jgi:hypothetical protein